jgi:alpha-glucosidase
MQHYHLALIFFLNLIVPTSIFGQNDKLGTIKSPDKKLTVNVLKQEGGVAYAISRGNTVVLEPSDLGIRKNGVDFSKNLKLTTTSPATEKQERYELASGKKRKVDNAFTEQSFTFEHPKNRQKMLIIFRVFNDGVAFRYQFPSLTDKETVFEQEYTTFNLPDNGEAWVQRYDTVTKWSPGYEQYFENALPVGQKSNASNGWVFPALFKANEQWILLTESDLDKQYCAMHLQSTVEKGNYGLRLPEAAEAENIGKQQPSTILRTWLSPWRVIITSPDLGNVVASTLVTDVARPKATRDYSWVRPGRATWSWWSDTDSPKDTTKLNRFSDYAAETGWEYNLVDANWNTMKPGSIEGVLDYAKRKSVGIWLWYNSGGPHNTVEEAPRDLMLDRAKRRAELTRIARMGVKGIKIDFFQSDKQHIIAQYIDILEDAAEFKIMINFHGCTIPRGWQRTYPHLLSMEAVRGAECYLFAQDYPAKAPAQNTILPVTRNVIGPMDYTVTTLSNAKYPHLTTAAHELALGVLFESGIVHLADKPDSYRNAATTPEVRIYLKNLPVVWDDVRYLGGTPGKDMVIARRAGSKWYIGGINGESMAKDMSVDLAALDLPTNCPVTILADGADAKTIAVNKDKVKRKMTVKMAAFGGFVATVRLPVAGGGDE